MEKPRETTASQPETSERYSHPMESREHIPSSDKESLRPDSTRENLDTKKSRQEVEALARESKEFHRPQKSSERKAEDFSITRADKEHTYDVTLSHTQNRLPAISKMFSRIVHQPLVESTSEVLADTIARPSGILGAGVFAFIGLAIMLFFARRNGFALSGFEFLLFIIIGWTLGVFIEMLNRFYKRHRH